MNEIFLKALVPLGLLAVALGIVIWINKKD